MEEVYLHQIPLNKIIEILGNIINEAAGEYLLIEDYEPQYVFMGGDDLGILWAYREFHSILSDLSGFQQCISDYPREELDKLVAEIKTKLNRLCLKIIPQLLD